ncbi:MAG: type II toxin-antitoxin system CcdA family antitoxin, partial [Candidatus Hodarchaeota archaeon]
MGKKITVGIYVDEETVKTAKELGFNISKLCENCLKEAIRRLRTPSSQTVTNGGLVDARSASHQPGVVGRAGFEPATFCTSSRCPNRARRP